MVRRRGVLISSAVSAVLLIVLATSASAARAAALPVTYSPVAAGTYAGLHPDTPPPGANDWSCHPTSAHPYPVVLVHGFLENMTYNWYALSPLLKNAGYCVYAFNYGQEDFRFGGFPGTLHPGGTAPIETSAAQLASFVDQVLAASGARKVDIVGHSEGGLMPRYYLKFLGGAPKVDALVGLSPVSHGTTLDGATMLGTLPGAGAGAPGVSRLLTGGLGEAFPEEEAGSPFIQKLDAGGDTVPGVRYTVIETKYDEVVTPYTSAFLTGPNVTNVLLQDRYGLDLSEHFTTPFDSIALGYVLNALDPAHTVDPGCRLALPPGRPRARPTRPRGAGRRPVVVPRRCSHPRRRTPRSLVHVEDRPRRRRAADPPRDALGRSARPRSWPLVERRSNDSGAVPANSVRSAGPQMGPERQALISERR